ncbi:MAG: alpha/beta hydrolase family protein, partial [Gemmatimonadaceae bacterium]
PHLIGAVLPAIDRVGSLGVVDTSRVAVMGVSYGGWTTLALITQTQRFRSAVAFASASDQLSYSGTFRAWDRPWPYAHIVMAPAKMLESGQQRLGGPMWQYPERYIEDSPVLQANRVTTPTMLIQGDQDFEGIQQAEEFFNALYRLGKRATFVRYIGDTHAIESPANIRDMWQRISAWLAETLAPDPGDASRAAPN